MSSTLFISKNPLLFVRPSLPSTFKVFQRFNSSNVSISINDTATTKNTNITDSKEDEAITSRSTESNIIPADVVSEEIKSRTVKIFKPAPSAAQSGTHNSKHWRIDFDILEGGSKWENPLMGWPSSADSVQALQLKFRSKEDAIRFAEKQGWEYFIQENREVEFHKKSYSDNYKYSPGKLRIIKTK
nr:9950_t:CDS:2 [Entrophospora candida]